MKSEIKYTPEPWFEMAHVSGIGCAIELATISGKRIASVGNHHLRADGDLHEMYDAYADNPGFELPEANAQRICACVNACAGMSNPEKEIAALREVVEAAKEHGMNCNCSPRDRLSGHRSGCFVPQLEQALAQLASAQNGEV